jgi:hypothetical protein
MGVLRFGRDCIRGGASAIEIQVTQAENRVMVLHGRIENGGVVFPTGLTLPEGTEVTVVITPVESTIPPSANRNRVKLPLVSSDEPGSRQLDADSIAKILDDEDTSSSRQSVVGVGF